jgi:hypothetical protein
MKYYVITVTAQEFGKSKPETLRLSFHCYGFTKDKLIDPKYKKAFVVLGPGNKEVGVMYNDNLYDGLAKKFCSVSKGGVLVPGADFASVGTEKGEPMAEGKKVIRLTESDLVRLVKRVLEEQTSVQKGPVKGLTPELDYWNKIILPILTKEGFKLIDETKKLGEQKCPYACCEYLVYPDHNTGVNLILDCGDDPTRTRWTLKVYYQGNKGLKSFDVSSNSYQAAKNAIDYVLALKHKLYPPKNVQPIGQGGQGTTTR